MLLASIGPTGQGSTCRGSRDAVTMSTSMGPIHSPHRDASPSSEKCWQCHELIDTLDAHSILSAYDIVLLLGVL